MRQTSSAAKMLDRQAATVTDRLLTVREVAARLCVSTRQIWKLLASGQLPPAIRLSRSVRFRESDFADFLAAGCDMTAVAARRAGGEEKVEAAL